MLSATSWAPARAGRARRSPPSTRRGAELQALFEEEVLLDKARYLHNRDRLAPALPGGGSRLELRRQRRLLREGRFASLFVPSRGRRCRRLPPVRGALPTAI